MIKRTASRNFAPREHALEMTFPITGALYPICDEVEVVGSIRRMRAEVSSVEILCAPKIETDLFGEPVPGEATSQLKVVATLEAAGYTITKDGPYFKCIDLGQLKCYLYITTLEKWGVMMVVRTGPEEFVHNMTTSKQEYGYMPSNLRVDQGRVWRGKTALPTPNEQSVFELWGMPFIPPFKRIR